MQDYRHLNAVHNLLFLALFAFRCETHIARKVPKIQHFYEFTLCRHVTTSTWHERTESTSFTGRFVRLDPRLFLSSWSYARTYQFLYFIILLKTFQLYNRLVSFESERKFLISSQILLVFFFEVLL